MNDILQQVHEWMKTYEYDQQRMSFLEQLIEEKEQQREVVISTHQLLEQVRVCLQQLAEVTRDQIMEGLKTVVTLCLQHVFGPEMSFEIEVSTLRNNTAIEFFVVIDHGKHVVRMKPEDTMGGGVLDTVSIGLRFGLLRVLDPLPYGPIFLDEPAKMVSQDKVEYIGHLLKDLSQMFEKQIILVTHHTQLYDIADKGIFVEQTQGRSMCQ